MAHLVFTLCPSSRRIRTPIGIHRIGVKWLLCRCWIFASDQAEQQTDPDPSDGNSQSRKKESRRAIVVAPIPISSPAIGSGVILTGVRISLTISPCTASFAKSLVPQRETFSAELRSICKWVLPTIGHTAYCLFPVISLQNSYAHLCSARIQWMV